MNILKKKSLLLLYVLLTLGCINPFGGKEQSRHIVRIPDFILAKSDSLIILKTGRGYFLKYIKCDSTRLNDDSHLINDEADDMLHAKKYQMENDYPKMPYSVLYRFKFPQKPWIDEPLRVNFDSLGNIVEPLPEEIPEYLSNPNGCSFRIDSSMAVTIAKEDGLEEGRKPWRVTFGWSGPRIKKYTWAIQNYIYLGEGKIRVIDANSGIILERSEWTVSVFYK
jgi:hypothetical protein